MNAEPLRVAIRADASAEIGLGHVRRCLSLAQALVQAGTQVRLVSRDLGVDVRTLAARNGIETRSLPAPGTASSVTDGVKHAAWARVSWQQDAAETVAAVGEWAPHWVVVDHYAFDARWHRSVTSGLGARLAAVDDLADRLLDAAVVVDHNYHADHRGKYAGLLSPLTKLLGGPRFALLAPAYETARRYTFSAEVRSIGIFMGGIDRDDWSSRVLAACRTQARFTGPIEIATTSANPNLAAMRELWKRSPGTRITIDAEDLAAFFSRHDLQIGAGGGATWERCCIGAATLVLACADNQRAVVAALADAGAVATVSSPGDATQEEIGRAISELVIDVQRRRRMSANARMLVDGLGARRVALRLAGHRIWLRRVVADDARRIYDWRNHEATRRVSRDSSEIPWPAHLGWLSRALADDNRVLLIGAVGSIPVGVIRFDGLSGTEAEVSLYLDPALHGLGLGTALLGAGERYARNSRAGLRRFIAIVLEQNVSSQRIFQAAHYRREDRDRWVKDLAAAR